jgi:multidrug efflux pump subunit AcrB
MNIPFDRALVDQIIAKNNIKSVAKASIREVKKIIDDVEAATGEKFVRMEMGIPGIPAVQLGVDAEIEALKKDKAMKANEFNQKLKKAKSLVEHYKKIANEAVDRYISAKARMLGVSSDHIKSRLKENYSFDDVDAVYENLQNYQVTMSKLPFNAATNNSKNLKVKVTESVEPIRPKAMFDDEVDDSLLRLGGLD